MAKTEVVAVRLSPEQVAALDDLSGQLSRGAFIRLIIQDFLDLPEKKKKSESDRLILSKRDR